MARLVENTLGAFASFGDRLALVDGGTSLTCREPLSWTHRFAHALRRRGLRRGDGIGCLAGNRWEVLPLKFAAQMLGLRFVAMDPSHVVGGLPFLVRDIDAAMIVTDPALGDPPAHPHVVLLDSLVSAAAEESAEPVAVQAADSDIAQLVHTGGTTGESKAVVLTFEALESATASFAARARRTHPTRA